MNQLSTAMLVLEVGKLPDSLLNTKGASTYCAQLICKYYLLV